MNYQEYYDEILQYGFPASPRGLKTFTRFDQKAFFVPGRLIRRPKDNPAIGLIELLQILAGKFDHKSFEVAAPNSRLDLFTEQMAYGPRIGDQLERVVAELRGDPDSRRAQITIARPDDPPEVKPCTIAAQFHSPHLPGARYVRGVTSSWFMRSSDAVWGLPNDCIQFGGVTIAVANCLRLPTQVSTVLIGNAHIYESTLLRDGEKWTDEWEFDLPIFHEIAEYRDWATRIISLYPTRDFIFDVFKVRKISED